HQFRNQKAGDNSRDRAANRHLVRNDEMFEVDKWRDDKDGNENPVGDCDLPWKNSPHRQKKQGSDQFDAKITEGDLAAAVGTAPAKREPAHQRQVLAPGDLLFAIWAK